MWFKLVILVLLKFCAALEDTSETANCGEFFHGNPWPQPLDSENRGVVKLCQRQKYENTVGKVLFATLFSTTDRIPLYTANTVTLLPNATSYDRPDSEFWNRVVAGLCTIDELPEDPIFSDIGRVDYEEYKRGREYQAVSADYSYNNMNLDRGHLSPNSINSQDQEKQQGTFTLSNAAPQFADFNRNSWREYECVAQHTILHLVPGEKVYILTGTFGVALDDNDNPLWINEDTTDGKKNPVKVPAYYWKAVCYPGNANKNKAAWGYAIVKENVNIKTRADFNSYITLKEFSQKIFKDAPFGSDCLNAPFGEFAKIFSIWEKYMDEYCKKSWTDDADDDEPAQQKEEL